MKYLFKIFLILFLFISACKLFCPDDSENQTNQKIAFLRDRDTTNSVYINDDDLWIMDMDGSNQTQLTFEINDITNFNFSPDGEKICFIRTYNYNNSDIYIMNSDGSDLKNLTNDDTYHSLPIFTSDSELLIFSSELPQLDVFTMNIDGSERTNITNTDSLSESSYQVLPNNLQILIGARVVPAYDTPSELYLIDIDGSTISCLTCQYDKLNPSQAQIISDGSSVLFLAWKTLWINSNHVFPLYLMDIDGSNLEMIHYFDVLENIYDIRLAPNDNYILYRKDVDLYRINIDGTEKTQLTQGLGDCFATDFSANGAYITFTSCERLFCKIYLMGADGSNQILLTEGFRSKFQPLSN